MHPGDEFGQYTEIQKDVRQLLFARGMTAQKRMRMHRVLERIRDRTMQRESKARRQIKGES